MKPTKSCDMPPLEIWAEGIGEYITWSAGKYALKPGAPTWAKEKLAEYEELIGGIKPGDGTIVIP